MSGGPKAAKQASERPLDGGVRRHRLRPMSCSCSALSSRYASAAYSATSGGYGTTENCSEYSELAP